MHLQRNLIVLFGQTRKRLLHLRQEDEYLHEIYQKEQQ